ncbi:MAG: hypothetical protein LIP02_05785 [Bacteroidales bacterium]|nr:hypothetical protein [Bacteroidales bacterium]
MGEEGGDAGEGAAGSVPGCADDWSWPEGFATWITRRELDPVTPWTASEYWIEGITAQSPPTAVTGIQIPKILSC